MAYNRKEREELSKHYTRVFDNTPSNLGFKYKKKGTYGPFYSREDALKKLKKL